MYSIPRYHGALSNVLASTQVTQWRFILHRPYPQRVQETIADYTKRLAIGLNCLGMMNIQFVIKDEKVYVIEVNPRASRTVPFLSKVTNIPMAQVATKLILGQSLSELGYQDGLYPESTRVHIKAPVFSFTKTS